MNQAEAEYRKKVFIMVFGALFIFFAIGIYLESRSPFISASWYLIGIGLLGYFGFMKVKAIQKKANTKLKTVDAVVVKEEWK